MNHEYARKASGTHPNSHHDRRILFLDYLRTCVVLWVVIHHAALAYLGWSGYQWIVIDRDKSIVFDFLARINDLFMMPVLFFIAGYFAISSLEHRGIVHFLNKKFTRLGIPFLLGVFFLNPITFYAWHLVNGERPSSYLQYWLFTYLPIESSSMHFWFLSCLLFLMLLACVFYIILKGWNSKERFVNPSFKFLLGFSFLTSCLFFLVNLMINDETWLNLMGTKVLRIQPTRFTLYFSYFFLGMLAWKQGWDFGRGLFSRRHLRFWLFATVVLVMGEWVFTYFFYKHLSASRLLMFGNAFLHAFTCLSIMITLIVGFSFYFNQPSRLMKKLSVNSYSIYLIHLPIVVALQFLLLGYSTTPFLKFVLVALLSLAVSYGISEYGLRRLPGAKAVL